MTEVAITGIGVVSPLGHGLEPFWRGLLAGESGLRRIRRFAAGGAGLGGEVPPLDPKAFIRTTVGRRIDWVSLMALAACRYALADAGLEPGRLVAERTGLAIGSAFANLEETTSFLDRFFARGAGNPLLFPNLVFNAPLSYASIELGITGPTVMLSAQEASGEAAIGWAADLVSQGTVDVCLAGSVEELSRVLYETLHEAGRLAPGTPRPFDLAAEGTCPGEGAAILVLETFAAARARGARVYARLVPRRGFAVPSPVHGWPRDAKPLAKALESIVADADVVFAAASGRPELDRVEADALAQALGGRRAPITAVRGAVGDFGAAGALAAAAAACAIAFGAIPPTLGTDPPARAGLDVVAGVARRGPLRIAVVNGLARGGLCRPLRLEAA